MAGGGGGGGGARPSRSGAEHDRHAVGDAGDRWPGRRLAVVGDARDRRPDRRLAVGSVLLALTNRDEWEWGSDGRVWSVAFGMFCGEPRAPTERPDAVLTDGCRVPARGGAVGSRRTPSCARWYQRSAGIATRWHHRSAGVAGRAYQVLQNMVYSRYSKIRKHHLKNHEKIKRKILDVDITRIYLLRSQY
jgi:hypothetical protein